MAGRGRDRNGWEGEEEGCQGGRNAALVLLPNLLFFYMRTLTNALVFMGESAILLLATCIIDFS